ncbi:hypothetical protein BGZ76_007340 [Entomortierella beljakovae]|nr:hypothetical protein BGZ76_007340 [Entomortierella beljakovae]
MFTAAYPKLRSWFNSVTSPSTTHASSMLIILGILAAVTDAQNAEEPIRVHHPKVSSSKSNSAGEATTQDEAKAYNNQDMIYYIAMGMLVSQGLIRLLTYISNRREAAALAAAKKDDDLLNKGKGKKGLSLNALEEVDMDDEAIKRRRSEHLAALGKDATLLESDSDDDDYEESDDSESESDVSDEESEVEDIVEDDETEGHRVLGSSHQH